MRIAIKTAGCLVVVTCVLQTSFIFAAESRTGPAAEMSWADLAAAVKDRLPWRPLWDGRSFQGWHQIGKGRWAIEQGAIVGRHEAGEGEFGHIVSDQSYSDFVIRCRYKAVKGNSGLYFRVEEKGFSGVSGFQAEVDEAADAGGLYETNGRGWVSKPGAEAVQEAFKKGDWNEMFVAALGRDVTVFVNGKKMASVRNDPGRLDGRFALQLHGGQAVEVWFKDLEICVPTNLTSGPGMAGWRAPTGEWAMVGEALMDAANEKALAVQPGSGVIYNGPKGRTSNLFSELAHGDVLAHVEFVLPKKSNSGVYFQSRYEVQVYDSYGVEKDAYPGIECGGIYPRWVNNKNIEGHSPRVNASRPPGQWQSFDVLFRAPRFDSSSRKTEPARFDAVLHNDVLVHENVVLNGPTRAAVADDEKALAPLMLQGDHGPIAYRNIKCILLGK